MSQQTTRFWRFTTPFHAIPWELYGTYLQLFSSIYFNSMDDNQAHSTNQLQFNYAFFIMLGFLVGAVSQQSQEICLCILDPNQLSVDKKCA